MDAIIVTMLDMDSNFVDLTKGILNMYKLWAVVSENGLKSADKDYLFGSIFDQI